MGPNRSLKAGIDAGAAAEPQVMASPLWGRGKTASRTNQYKRQRGAGPSVFFAGCGPALHQGGEETEEGSGQTGDKRQAAEAGRGDGDGR